MSSPSILSQIHFRIVTPTDMPTCYEIEQASYPSDEAATKSSLQYRQHHAAPYFRCAVLGEDDEDVVVGYICSTRCREFTEESMSLHEPNGPLLAIHSVVVSQQYRHQGIARAMMKDYVDSIKQMDDGVETLVLMAKSNLLGFYVQCGFSVMRPSAIVHGKDLWYHCELNVQSDKNLLQGYPCWVVDSFASQGGTGNPAAVVLLPAETDVDSKETIAWMEVAAKEFNLSETAFVWPNKSEEKDESVEQKVSEEDDEENDDEDDEDDESTKNGQFVSYSIRYFTCNGTQVDLCGHATLASAAVLVRTSRADYAIHFHAKKHVLKAWPHGTWRRNSPNLRIQMDFPKKGLKEITTSADRSAVLGMLKKAFSMPDTAENILYIGLDEDGGDVLVELTRESFSNLPLQGVVYSALMEWDGYSRGVILCCRGEGTPDKEDEEEEEQVEVIDFFSRFFGPKAGINEDPVTGSAHCTLSPYFAAKLNKTTLVGKQMSERQGVVTCVVEEDRVSIIGATVMTMSGSLCI